MFNTYIIAQQNSVGVITSYLDAQDGDARVLMFPDRKLAEESLASLSQEDPQWADFKIFKIILDESE